MQYATLFIDADGTLFDFRKSEQAALIEAVSSTTGKTIGTEEVTSYRKLNAALWQKFERGEVAASTVKTRRFRQFIDACELPVRAEELAEAYLQKLSGKAYLLPGVLQTLENLSGTCRMALLTNGFSTTQRSRIAISGIADYFEAIVISEEVGFTKPDPRIFEQVADFLGGISKPHTLMIGDSPSSDIRGGSNFGIDTCLIDPDGSLKSSTPPPTFRITRIEEIVAILQERTPGA